MNEQVGYSGGNVFLTFLAGAAVGSVVALLLAPYSGKESRERIRAAASAAGERARRIPVAMRDAGTAARTAYGESVRSGKGNAHDESHDKGDSDVSMHHS